MILIGQYDSPFVRRVAVAMNLYGLAYEHWPWSVFGDAHRLAAYNPLRRVPTLLLDDGEVLIESMAILDHLDSQVEPAHRLISSAGSDRRAALRFCALATGLCDKLVSLVYERVLHEQESEVWIARCTKQVADVLVALEQDCATLGSPYWFGSAPGHADVAMACAMRLLAEAHPDVHAAGAWPALTAHSSRCEALPAFSNVVQRFNPPRG